MPQKSLQKQKTSQDLLNEPQGYLPWRLIHSDLYKGYLSSKFDSSLNHCFSSVQGRDFEDGVFKLLIKEADEPKTSAADLLALYKLIRKSQQLVARKHAFYRVLARNPNTPESLLFKLWGSFPAQFLQNPITDLWSFASPETIKEKLPLEVKLSIYIHLIKKGKFIENHFFFPDNERRVCAKASIGSYPKSHPINYQKTVSLECLRSPKYKKKTERYFAMDPIEDIRAIVAGGTLKEETIMKLAEDKSEMVRQALAKNRAIPKNAHNLLSLDSSKKVRLSLAENNLVGFSETIKSGWGGFDFIKNSYLTANKISDYDGLLNLAKDDEIDIRIALAKNSARSSEALYLLASDKNEIVRSTVAQNYPIDSKTYHKLVGDTIVVRQALALNDGLTIKQKIELINDSNSLVRNAVVDKYRGVSKYFWEKALGSNESVRASLAARSGVPGDVLVQLAKDPSNDVRRNLQVRLRTNDFQQRTQTNINLVDILSRDTDSKIRAEILKDWRISDKRLGELVFDPEEKVRLSLAKRSFGVDIDYYGQLAIDESSKVRLAAAKNILFFGHSWGTHNQPVNTENFSNLKSVESFLLPQTHDKCDQIRLNLAESIFTPAVTLNELVDDVSEKVRKRLLCRKFFPRDVYIRLSLKPKTRKLLWKGNGFCLTSNVLRHSALSTNAYVRAMTARNAQTPIRVLRKLVNDKCWLVRGQLAQNPSCPKNLIAQLSNDNEKLVQQTANIRLKKYDS